MSTYSAALGFLIIALLAVVLLYGRSVIVLSRHALKEVVRYLTLLLGLLFISLLLFALWVHG
jgi:hypothetical protein